MYYSPTQQQQQRSAMRPAHILSVSLYGADCKEFSKGSLTSTSYAEKHVSR